MARAVLECAAAIIITRPHGWHTPLVIGMLLSCLGVPAGTGGTQLRTSSPRAEATWQEAFRTGQALAGFQVMTHYTNQAEQPAGLRLTHVATGTPVHILQMDTVPQAAIAVRTYPDSDHGAAHALEHLLIGKGTTGRTLQALADMHLGQVTASTGERYTWYHFAVESDMASFYEVLRHLLEALFRPDFSDAEAQQEVYHLGVTPAVQADQHQLIEQGTVYTEMQSYQGMYDYWYALLKRMLGASHPLTFPAGGTPDGIRRLTPREIRQFHRQQYVVGATTPLVIIIDRQQDPIQVLTVLADMLTASAPEHANMRPTAPTSSPPRLEPADDKTPQMVPMPSLNATDPAHIAFGWQAVHLPSLADRLLLEAFLAVFGRGNQSILYRSLVDRQTRALDVGATAVDSRLLPTYDRKRPLSFVWVEGIAGNRLTRERVEAIRKHITAKFHEVATYADDSPELLAFNREILSYLTARQRSLAVWQTNPPGFGQRRMEPLWIEHLEALDGEGGVQQSLVLHSSWRQLRSVIDSGQNLWRRLLERAGLLETPYSSVAIPSPAMHTRLERARHERLAAAVTALRNLYGATDGQEALRRFANDQARQDHDPAAALKGITFPRFTARPPRTFDDSLSYAQSTIAGVPAVVSSIAGMSLAEIGLAFDLHGIPAHLQRYLPLLPGLLRSIGLREDGMVSTPQASADYVQRLLHRLEVNYRLNPEADRYELVLKASGVGPEEFQAALEYVRRITHDNDLSAENLPRLHDLLQHQLHSERTLTQRPEEEWIETLAQAFRYQNSHLFLSLGSQPTRYHHLNRLTWLLAGPLPPDMLADLQGFSARLLGSLRALSVAEMEQRLAGVQETGWRGQLIDYWRAHLRAWPAPLVWEGLQRLNAEVLADLQVGHTQAIQEMRQLQALVLNHARMRLWLVGDQELLQRAHPDVEALVQSFPRQAIEGAPGHHASLVWARIRQRQPRLTPEYPAYVGYVQEGAVTGSVIVTAKGPTYPDHDESSLVEVLAAKVLAGTGPHTWYKQTWEVGLAYGNGLDIRPRAGTLLYYADRCPSIRATLAFVRSLAQDVSWLSEPSYVDYALAQTFNFSRAAQPWTARAEAMAIDLAEGLTPAQMQHFSQRLLALRQDPRLLERLREALPRAVAKVTLGREANDIQSAAQTVFFVIAPEAQLAELEADIPRRRLARVWPSDFWLD